MSRTIKFRVWHPASGKLYYEWMPENRAFFGHEEFDGGASLSHFPYRDNVHPFKLGPCSASRNNEGIVWEQFTGLKDKNGKEIYEGDVLEHVAPQHVYGEGAKVHGIVRGGPWAFRVEQIDNLWMLSCIGDRYTYGGIWPEEAVVIGNIHDNPELLT